MSLGKFATTAGILLATSAFAIDSYAATIRVQCEVRNNRSKISVDGNNLPAGSYSAIVLSGANSAQSTPVQAVGGEVEVDFDSNPNDVAAGAVRITPQFITVGQNGAATVTGKIVGANGATVISDTVNCRVSRR